MRNIAFIHKTFPYGGAERISIDIARFSSQYGYKSYVFTWNEDESKLTAEIKEYISIIRLPDSKEQHSMVNANFIAQQIAKNNIMIFIIQGDNLPYLSFLKSQVPTCKFIFSYHGKPLCEALYTEIDATIRHTHNRSLWTQIEWKYLRNIKYKLTNRYKAPIISLYKESYENVDAFIVLCEEYKATFVKELKLDPSNNKMIAISNPERGVGSPNLNKKKQIIFIGRMTYPDKRIERLIHIWKEIYSKAPEWELLLIGEGPEKSNLEKLAIEQKLPRIRFMGYSNDTSAFYKDATILCLTSTTEGWPLCLTEAQTNGVIPIAFGCSAGIKRILSPSGTNGFIIPPFNLRKYKNTLLHIINHPELQKEIQRNVIHKSKDYSIDIVGKEWIQLFNQLLRDS